MSDLSKILIGFLLGFLLQFIIKWNHMSLYDHIIFWVYLRRKKKKSDRVDPNA